MNENQQSKAGIGRYGKIDASDKDAWHQIIADWERSSQSQSKFCKAHKLSKNTFSYWRGKYLASGKRKKAENLFVPIQVKARAAQPSSHLKLQTPEGYVFSIPMEGSEVVLPSLLSALGVSDA